MKIALMCIATGAKYRAMARTMLESAEKFFPAHDSFVWSDDLSDIPVFDYGYPTSNLMHPMQTLARYHLMLAAEKRLNEYDQVFYCDADMKFVAPVKAENIISDGITAVLHPGFITLYNSGTTETRKESTAYLEGNKHYFFGAFNGGAAKPYLEMAKTIRGNINTDLANSIIAVWWDESHLNRYLADNPPAKILSPSYGYPEKYDGESFGWSPNQYPPILVNIEKDSRGQ